MRISKPALLFVLASIGLLACPDPPPSPGIPRNKTPIPEKNSTAKGSGDGEAQRTDTPPIDHKSLVKGPLTKRFSEPGAVRWTMELTNPISKIRWSTLAGLVVSAGKEIHNVTSLGEHRFRYVAGDFHKLYALGETEIVWSPKFEQLTQLMRWGRTGWTRKWNAQITSDSRGELYLVDASTVSAIDESGKDKWRLALEGVRKIEGPFTCKDSVLFQGTSGLKRLAVRVSTHGSLIQKTVLGRGAVLIGAGPNCEPLVWLGGEVAMLDHGGKTLYKRSLPKTPFVTRLQKGFAFVSSRAELPAYFELIDDHGRPLESMELPIKGRLTDVDFISENGTSISAIGLCSDVTHPCSKPGTTRGPFNTLITMTQKNEPRSLIRHVQGHLGFAKWPDGGLVTGSSKDSESTDVTLRTANNSIAWNVSVPGRLSAEPFVGPSSEVYLATCKGWDCAPPYTLFSITGKKPTEDTEE